MPKDNGGDCLSHPNRIKKAIERRVIADMMKIKNTRKIMMQLTDCTERQLDIPTFERYRYNRWWRERDSRLPLRRDNRDT